MIFDFSGRVRAAFGFVTAAASRVLYDKMFGESVKDSQLKVDVYASGKDATFDEITLRYNTENYYFAYRSFSEDYSGIFATPPMLSMRRAKRLVITPIDNSDIEVIERYGTEPWEITWRGLLIDMENHEFPIDKLEAINKIFEANREWTVDSEILRKVGVETIYISDISIDFVEGFEDTIAYTMTTRALRSLEVQLSN